MPSVAEILLRSRDQYSQAMKAAREELKRLGVEGKVADQSLAMLERRMNQSTAKQVVDQWEDLEDGVKRTGREMGQASAAASGLSRMIGIELPQSVTKFLSQSSTIGPVLTGAFSAVAVLGLIQVLGQLPALFDKISGSITGWSENAKKAFDEVIAKNRELVEAMKASERLTATLAGGERGGILFNIAEQVEKRNRALAAIRGMRTSGGPPEVFSEFGPAQPLQNREQELKDLQKAADDATQEIKKLEIALTDIEKKAAPAIAAAGAKLANFLRGAESALTAPIGRTGLGGLLGGGPGAMSLGGVLSPAGPTISQAEMLGFAAAGTAQMRLGGVEQQARMFAAREIDSERLRAETERFFSQFEDSAGRAWDAFTARGMTAIQKLTNIATMFLDTIGRTLFQNFATGLVGGRGFGGGIAGFAGKLGGGIGGKLGLGALFGGGGLGLGAATGTIGAVAGGVPAGLAAAQGSLMTLGVGSAGATAGAGASTGLLAGISATGWGAIIAGGILAGVGISKLFRKTQEAEFTKDPFEAFTHAFEFYTAGQIEVMRDISNTLRGLKTQPPGVLVKEGLPIALQSSNMFRRDVQGLMSDDL